MLQYMLLGAALFALATLIALVRVILSPQLKYHSFWYKIKAWLVFNLGHIRRLDFFPYFTIYGYDVHKMTLRAAREVCSLTQPGDIGLHRDQGFLSNLAIPGGFKHAWIFVGNNDCIEAVAEGVLKRDALVPLYSDYVIILRPRGVSPTERKRALRRAENLVGCEYDANFRFDFEKEEEAYVNCQNLCAGAFHAAFSCTEVASWAWYGSRNKLGISRSVYAGREAVIADDFVRFNFDIVWISQSVTVEWAEKQKMHPDAIQKIKNFLSDNHP